MDGAIRKREGDITMNTIANARAKFLIRIGRLSEDYL